MAKLVAGTYGDALFDFAMEENQIDSLMDEILTVQAVLEENKGLEKILVHPEIPKQKKLQVIEDVFKGRISDALTGFLRIVVTKGRYKNLPDIFAYFIARVKEYKKIGVAEVISAIPLSGEQKEKIEKKLLDTTHYETMEIEYKVDEKKIGGLMIRIGDRVVDSTIQSKLNLLTGSLLKISLESEKEGVQAS
ncbi:MAG: ATP synthase F1 subunit delta [Lachnospiraceae bacterium]|nr:ATP synthase F1 subunit delta [Lachnospiraceae bacterium]MDD7077037.1 ATP synthase F1 subunit delta [Lachnospiraceae bacterium]MDY3729876.1 ATP synthase F1 subunit delta [Candidatus Choladocola sp.]